MYGRRVEAKIQARINEKLQEQIKTLETKVDALDKSMAVQEAMLKLLNRKDELRNNGRFFEPWTTPADMSYTFVQQPRGSGKAHAQREAVKQKLFDEFSHVSGGCVCPMGYTCAYVRSKRKTALNDRYARRVVKLPHISVKPAAADRERVECECGYYALVNKLPHVDLSARIVEAHLSAHNADRNGWIEAPVWNEPDCGEG